MGFGGVKFSSYNTSATEKPLSPYSSPKREAVRFSKPLQPSPSNYDGESNGNLKYIFFLVIY